MNTPVADYDRILQTINQWPPDQRLILVQEVLKSLKSAPESQRARRQTLDKALGLLTTEYPTPSDEQIKQWLNERRMEKYG